MAPVTTKRVLRRRGLDVPPKFYVLQKSEDYLVTNDRITPRRMENETALFVIERTQNPVKFDSVEARSCVAD